MSLLIFIIINQLSLVIMFIKQNKDLFKQCMSLLIFIIINQLSLVIMFIKQNKLRIKIFELHHISQQSMQGEWSLSNEQSFTRDNFVLQQVKQMWVGALDSAH